MSLEKLQRNKSVQNVIATMAIENMYLNKEFVEELLKTDSGEKTTEQLRQEVIRKYAR